MKKQKDKVKISMIELTQQDITSYVKKSYTSGKLMEIGDKYTWGYVYDSLEEGYTIIRIHESEIDVLYKVTGIRPTIYGFPIVERLKELPKK